jgi:SAM-dependent methyltransferase
LGWDAGFDSGRTLDYVYQNKPQGITPLGRAFDRAYLNTIGWRGIRARKTSLKDVLREAIEKVHQAGRPVRVLDIASGPGRYLLEAIRELDQGTLQNLSLPHECGVPRAAGTPHSCGSVTPSKQSLERPPDHIPVTLLLRDYKQENVQAARCLAHDLGVRNVEAVQGDAFDRASLAALTPRPTVAIVSGLYELFPSNEPVLNSLRGLADAMEPGSYLVYTNQPWHPQVEFIARVLTTREGKPWIMRRRTQAEMDELVREAGFAKERQEIDPWGIFSVSLARRIKS